MKIEFTVFSRKKELRAGAGFGLFLAYMASLVVGQFLAQALFEDREIFTSWGLNAEESWDTILYVFGNALGKVIGGSLVLGFILLYLRKNPGQMGCSTLGIVRVNPYLCLAMFFLGLAINLFIYFLVRPIFTLEGREISDGSIGINEGSEGLKYFYIICTIVIAPILEECLFRGVLYNSFTNSYGKFISALATTFLFAIVHPNVFLTGHWVDVFYLLLISSALLGARVWFGSLLPSIFMHSGANSAIVFPV